MKYLFVVVIVISLLDVSCSRRNTTMVTCDLHPTDFSEILPVNGTTQAVNTVNIMAPMNYYGNMTVASILPEGTRVQKDDTICVLECSSLMQLLEKEEQNRESLLADLTKQEADNQLNRALLEANLKENKATMAINELDSLQMRFAPPMRKKLMELELEKSRVEARKLEKKSEAEKKIDETEIRQLNSRIAQSDTRLKLFRDLVKSLTVISPGSGVLSHSDGGDYYIMSSDGTVIRGNQYPKVGGGVSRRMPIAALPDLSKLQVSVQVQEVDFKRIQAGQKVDIIIDAAGNLKTTGMVKSKSMTGKTDEYSDSKVKWYDVIVSIDSLHERIAPGLSAHCNICINSVPDTVVIPTLAIFERDSQKIVYVSDGERFRQVAVETGLSNGSHTLITGGLKGTETIALIEPPHNLIEKNNTRIHD